MAPIFDPLNSDYASQLFSSIGKKLYLSSELADVHFVFESNDTRERVPAHKVLLMAASDVFTTMFNGSWKEKDEVIIADTSVAAFKQFLQFFYFGQVKLTMEHVDAVMNLGEMYNVVECLAVCSKFLKNNLNDDNVCRNYGLAILFNQPELKKSCKTVIGFNTNAVLKSAGFLACDQQVLAQILKQNWLTCTEAELFEACMSWVKSTSQQDSLTKELVQTHLGELLYEFRFGSMSLQEFATLTLSYGHLFTAGEYNDFIQMIANNDLQATVLNRNREKRCESNAWDKGRRIDFNRILSKKNSTQPYFIQVVETTKFSVNEPLLLKGFTINFIKVYRDRKYSSCEDLSSDITIVEISDSNDSKKEMVQYSGKVILTPHVTQFDLSKPILIRPGCKYEIRLKQKPPKDCAIGILLKSEVQKHDGITVQFHDDPLIPDDFSRTGLIYRLTFYRIRK